MRIPYAAKTLIDQATAAKPSTKATPVGDLDGFDVYRTIEFSKAASAYLAPLLEEIKDPRIADLEVTDKGLLRVTFVGQVKADDRHPFPLDEAALVLGQ